MPNATLIKTFYEAFTKGNSKTMVECYHQDIVFQDPAFGTLKGDEAKNMWRMLISRAKGDLKISFGNIEANDKVGSASWMAEYNYGPKKRKVINQVKASFKFKDGKIIEHIDGFNMWKWSKQALGLSGYLLGWSSFLEKKVQGKTNFLLKEFMKGNSKI